MVWVAGLIAVQIPIFYPLKSLLPFQACPIEARAEPLRLTTGLWLFPIFVA